MPGIAHAEDEAGPSANSDIIVTAQFREQKLQDTPIAITALSGADIENKALSNVSEIGATAPNVNINIANSAQAGAAVFIRGIGQYDSSFAFEPGVGVYIDDIYHGVMVGSMFELLDLDRVEILRGPQGTLAGKNSIGGAVKLFSRKPKGDNSGYISATYGSFNRIDIRGAYDIGLTGNLAMRVSAFSDHRDGHVKILDFACDRPGDVLPGDPPTQKTGSDCKLGTLGGVKSTGVRLAFRYTPTDKIEINLFGSIIRDDSEAAGIEQTATIDPRYLPTRPYVFYGTFTGGGWSTQPLATTHSESIGGQIDIDLADHVKLTSITGYEHLDSRNTIDLDGSPLPAQLTYNDAPYHQFTQELRLGGDFGDGLVDWTLGGYYFNSLGRVASRIWADTGLNWIQNDPVKSKSKSLFAHLEVRPVADLTLTAGIRYTDDRKSYKFVRLNPDTGVELNGGPDDPFGVGALNFIPPPTYSGDSFDYRLGVDYRFSEQFMAYASFSTGYKGGGVNPRPFTASQAVSFDPERVDAYEVGFKSDLAGGMVRFNVSAFLNKYNNIILVDGNGYPGEPGDPDWFPLSAVPFNAGKANIKGLEFETTIKPTEGLTLEGSLSYLDFKFTEIDPNAAASGITLDTVPPMSPKWKWSGSISYDIPLANGATITPRFYADYTDSYYTDPVNSPTNLIASRTILNANITFRPASDGWQLVAGVTNLTDKHYYTNAFDVISLNGTGSRVVARPREFFVTLRKNF
ncbi:MAG: TonB-dependent receptor [Novosphingobium sp.]|nr:TonB-dependent receptor [Novosphingobium sp.]MBO9601587.1 TonB-dependent receptor [Novosphingobium sp.]